MGTSGLWLVAQNPGDSLDVGLAWGRAVLGDRPPTCGSECGSLDGVPSKLHWGVAELVTGNQTCIRIVIGDQNLWC